MERRSFLKGLAGLIGGVALEQAVPFGRVWSFPKKIVISRAPHALPGRIDQLSLKNWFRIENQPLYFYELVGGQTAFPQYQSLIPRRFTNGTVPLSA